MKSEGGVDIPQKVIVKTKVQILLKTHLILVIIIDVEDTNIKPREGRRGRSLESMKNAIKINRCLIQINHPT